MAAWEYEIDFSYCTRTGYLTRQLCSLVTYPTVQNKKYILYPCIILYSQAITGLLAKPCSSTVNDDITCRIGKITLSIVQHIVTASRIDRCCSRMLEHVKPDLIQQQSSWLLWHRCSILLFHHTLPTCSIMYEQCCWYITVRLPFQQRCQQHCSGSSSRHDQSVLTCLNASLSTTLFKLASSTMFIAGQLNHVHCWPAQPCSCWPAQPCSQAEINVVCYVGSVH